MDSTEGNNYSGHEDKPAGSGEPPSAPPAEVHQVQQDNSEALHGLESEADPVEPPNSNSPPAHQNSDANPVSHSAESGPGASTTREAVPAESHQVPESGSEAKSAASGPAGPKTAKPTAALGQRLKLTAPANLKGFNRHVLVEAVLLIIIIILAVWGASANSNNTKLKDDNQKLQSEVANPQALVQQQTQDLLNKVGQQTKLPSGETPTIANVSDVNAARQQSSFFNNAQNGDQVLMYVKAGEAVLYRPSTNKVILVAPLTITKNTPTAPAAATPKK